MDLRFILASLVCFFFINHGHCQSKVYMVTDYGTISDGQTDDSSAFLNAWKDACATYEGGLYIPKGTYYVRGANFRGPCNGETYFQNDGLVIASLDIAIYDNCWIGFSNVNGLVISGQGTFDGNGENTWKNRDRINGFPPTVSWNLKFQTNSDEFTSNFHDSMSIKLEQITSGLVRDISSKNSKTFHITLNRCENVHIDHVTLSAPGDSPNTDGIHIGKSSNINITNSRIGTGDDCISIGDGSRNVHVSGVLCGPGHGISLGSLGRYEDEEDVSEITVTNCSLSKTTNGLRIKTWATSTATITVSKVAYSDIRLENVRNPMIIDQYYCPQPPCSQGESSVQIEDVTFTDIKGSSASDVAVNIHCSQSRPCNGIQLQGIYVTTDNGQSTVAYCSNADGVFLGDDQTPARCSPGGAVALRPKKYMYFGLFLISFLIIRYKFIIL